jgi:hypothetical protein
MESLHRPIPSSFFILREPKLSALIPSRLSPKSVSVDGERETGRDREFGTEADPQG